MKALPLLLRSVLLAGGFATIVSSSVQEPPRVWQLAHVFCCLLAGSGFMGRSASLLLVVLLAWHQSPFGASFLTVAIFSTAVTLMLTGSGRGSVWAPEEKILYRNQHEPVRPGDSP